MIKYFRRRLRRILEIILKKRGFILISQEGHIDFQRDSLIKQFEISRIIDVGVNEGQYSLLIKKSFKDIPISAFDPDPRVAEIVSKLNFSNFDFFNLGLGHEDSNNFIKIHEFLQQKSFQLSSIHSSRFNTIGVADFDCLYVKNEI